MTAPYACLLDPTVTIALRAGDEIMRHYHEKNLEHERKADGSPVTVADRASEAVILAGLRALTPDIPILSEEQVATGSRPDLSGGLFWCVDPLDGTKDFLRRTGEFTVCIALIHEFRPYLGVLHAPALNLSFAGCTASQAMQIFTDRRRTIRARIAPLSGKTAMVSRSHHDGAQLDRYLQTSGVTSCQPMGSAIKFGLLAAGQADLYVRFGPTLEWDTAAGEALLLAAGGRMSGVDGHPLRYGKEDLLNPGFIAEGAISE